VADGSPGSAPSGAAVGDAELARGGAGCADGGLGERLVDARAMRAGPVGADSFGAGAAGVALDVRVRSVLAAGVDARDTAFRRRGDLSETVGGV
jgi:hypothetical protein